MKLFLGSYPIAPATDVLHELSKAQVSGRDDRAMRRRDFRLRHFYRRRFCRCAGCDLHFGPGVCLKSEAMNLAVITELPLVVLDVQRGGPSPVCPPSQSRQTCCQALFGRNGESPMPVIAASSPTSCFDAAYMANKIALEHYDPGRIADRRLCCQWLRRLEAAQTGRLSRHHPSLRDFRNEGQLYSRTNAIPKQVSAIGPSPDKKVICTSSAVWRKTAIPVPSPPIPKTMT